MSHTAASVRQRSAVIAFAHTLVGAVLNRLLHARDSRFVLASMQELVDALTAAVPVDVEMPLQLQIDDHRMHYEGRPLDGPSLQARSLLQRCADHDIATLSFLPGLTAAEANRWFDLLLLPQNVGALDRAHRDATLTAYGIRHIKASLRTPGDPTNRGAVLGVEERALEHYQNLAESLQENHRLAHRDLELELATTAAAVERTLSDTETPSMLLAMSMQDDVDRFTVGHSVRVALLALQVAREFGASREQLVRIGAAGLMHDIGKSKVPQEVLFKQGQLTADEWRAMAEHPRLGAQILIEQHEQVDPRAIGAAFCHHMGPAGRGYPDPILPVQPSATSRLIRVCDVFEALTAVRPYKHALTPLEAYAVMCRNGNEFDPDWLRRLMRTLGMFPNGTRVEMADGAAALVVQQTDHIAQPIVRLLSGPAGEALPAGHPERITVGRPFEGRVPRIVGIGTHERLVPVPEFDPDDPTAAGGPTAHHACLSPTPHDHDD